ncbi:hypothetical protein KKH96_02470 [Patescibacteria group bacterium]|nr:hypothetical protein [Patescibacteria group bacterium]
MNDPLEKFNWGTLHKRYDDLCGRFNDNEYLGFFKVKPDSDRKLYYSLIEGFFDKRESSNAITLDLYKAMLYWKLYSQPAAVANILGKINNHKDIENRLIVLSKKLPLKIERNIDEIVKLVQINEISIFGMGSPDSFPGRTTFLHFVYPDIIPVFDKMVLQAVGVEDENANHSIQFLKNYIPFAWKLADKYKNKFDEKWQETPVRLIDMALWVNRGN